MYYKRYDNYGDSGNPYSFTDALKSLAVTGACHFINQCSPECGLAVHSLAGRYATNDVDRMLASLGVTMSGYDIGKKYGLL